MLSSEQKEWIVSNALVPEHLPDMMSYISGGDVGLFEDSYLYFRSNDWAIFVGYPLTDSSETHNLTYCIERFIKKYNPETLWLLSDKMPFCNGFNKVQEDFYYILQLPAKVNGNLHRAIRKASTFLKVEIDRYPTSKHKELIDEFISSRHLPENIKELYIKLPKYVEGSKDGFLLSAYTKEDGRLSAFFVIEMGAKRFSSYMIGCSSKTNYIPHAADLLMYELIRLSEQAGKEFVHLGIGVNEGIRRFKEKWGGKALIKYVTSEYKKGLLKEDSKEPTSIFTSIRNILDLFKKNKKVKTIWQLSRASNTSYLIGSTHMFSHSFVPFLKEIIQRVDAVVVEGPLDIERMQLVITSGINKKRLSLSDYVDNDTIELLAETYINAYFNGMPSSVLEAPTYFALKRCYIADIKDTISRYSHWMSYFSLWYMFLDHHKWIHSMDRDAVMLAKQCDKDVFYLESIDEQIEAMQGIPIERIVNFLKKADQWEGYITRFQKLYLKGSMNDLFSHTTEFPSRCESIIDKRDPLMFERMLPYLDRGNILILVGIGHIPGISERLTRSGYKIRDFYEIKR